VPTPTEPRPLAAQACVLALGLGLAFSGCGGPSPRELKNRQEFEALLTAVSLKDREELERDAQRIDARHDSGELSHDAHGELCTIIETARGGDWPGAERRAYEFRGRRPYFP
jgi:hypothetical protein